MPLQTPKQHEQHARQWCTYECWPLFARAGAVAQHSYLEHGEGEAEAGKGDGHTEIGPGGEGGGGCGTQRNRDSLGQEQWKK